MHFEDACDVCISIFEFLAHFAIARKKFIAPRALNLNIARTNFHALNFTSHAS
jgi:hypothetical protein